jgi:hypothetical protein
LARSREDEGRLRDEHRELNAQFQQARETAEQSKSGNKILNSLMDQKRRGDIPGIFGRLVRINEWF